MSLIAKFSVPIDAFVLGSALQLNEIERIEFDCNLPSHANKMPYFWVWGSHFDTFETVVERESAIHSVSVVDELEDTRLYRAEWQSAIPAFLDATQQSNGRIRSISGVTTWTFELRFEEQADLNRFTTYYADTEADLQLERLYALRNAIVDHTELTPAQRETLITAEQEGYYEEPSKTSMHEIAETLDVSQAAVSGRLRRGTSTLIQNTLL